ncbi:hypothetical protein ACHAPF_005254 [Botrytis cinerea]
MTGSIATSKAPQSNLCALGSIGVTHYDEINGKQASILVGLNPNQSPPSGKSPALARPTSYTQIWNDAKSGGRHDGAIWRPNAPSGYISLGDVVGGSHSVPPSTSAIWCLRVDLTHVANYAASDFWDDKKSGAAKNVSCWQLVPESTGLNGDEYLPISAGTFRAHGAYDVKPSLSLAYVPLLEVENQFQKFDVRAPSITPTTIPEVGDQFSQQEQCRVVLPFTAFYPIDDERSLNLIRNPFCVISRSIAWHCEAAWVNDTNGPFDRQVTIKYGVSKTQSESMEHSIGVEVSASSGIGLVEFSVNLNYQFTYNSSSSFTEFRESEVIEKINIPPRNATVLFSKHIWIKGVRADSSQVISQVEITANDELHFSGCAL